MKCNKVNTNKKERKKEGRCLDLNLFIYILYPFTFLYQRNTVHCLFCIGYIWNGALINMSSWADPISVTSGLKTSGSAYTELSYTQSLKLSYRWLYQRLWHKQNWENNIVALTLQDLGLWRYYGSQRLEFVGSGISSSLFLPWVERVSLCFHCLESSAHQSLVSEFMCRLGST